MGEKCRQKQRKAVMSIFSYTSLVMEFHISVFWENNFGINVIRIMTLPTIVPSLCLLFCFPTSFTFSLVLFYTLLSYTHARTHTCAHTLTICFWILPAGPGYVHFPSSDLKVSLDWEILWKIKSGGGPQNKTEWSLFMQLFKKKEIKMRIETVQYWKSQNYNTGIKRFQ